MNTSNLKTSVLCLVCGVALAGCAPKTAVTDDSIVLDSYATTNPSPVVTATETPSSTTQGESKMDTTTFTQATLQTSKGEIVLELYPQDAPKTVNNFATHIVDGYYDNLTFHRVEPGFVIQGGDPKGNGTGGTSIYGATFEDELNPNTASYKAGYKEGVLAMANRGPNTNGSQFFIMLEDNMSLPKNYTIFGKVTKGMDVVKKIAVGDKILKATAK